MLRDYEHKKKATLEAWGVFGEGQAKKLCPVDTGAARNSISHATTKDDAYIGSNLDYIPWLEWGTGIYASDGNGRQSPWGYYDRSGKYHVTRGQKPHHMLKKAATEHNADYKRILDSIYKR